uniref:Uncharacterized protein n=1 Tax=Mucochytrium quahogii TaxID=96639 RepID=A0A7S2RMW5_9STRA|mmetsp:Transcript_32580/g.51882  ORF Transcript_32580/g.51882 Transcript_32580/m.51882 type:complete len:381 (+) Transcript_32580:247-1389(+)|eukprot:CAMPEP_0203746078 /NCGR_PEP_ID=MMETSP0098-20131031/1629_1 /ASSEMBLY_ACC=CAM_ASM_000208 /TAXON_ID=96639 /ORGANISM=" , Strain NY0313808BC1" /LENGTH=380 /DNA_ID=CAMNT_0050634049 /DNA_START=281 /DNA_END=1423 /DNA_ORIENTATION=+
MTSTDNENENLMEHRYVKVGLLLSCLPLIFTVLGLPIFFESSFIAQNDAWVSLDATGHGMATKYVQHMDTVPMFWLKSALKQNASAARCGHYIPPVSERPTTIRHIRVIGERNSGVNGVVDLLRKVFPNVTTGAGFVRSRYWFQDESVLPKGINLDEVLVVVVLRNPVDWLRMMRKNPVYAPNHMFRQDWKHFVSKPWTMRTSTIDKTLSQTKGVKCQAKFLAGYVRPCRQAAKLVSNIRTAQPVYEMDPITTKPFRNIIGLRKGKLLNYANMSRWVPHISYVKVENLFSDSGVRRLQSVLSDAYNLGVCLRTKNLAFEFSDWITRPPLSTMQEVRYYSCNLDWSAEEVFGYSKPLGEMDSLPCSSNPNSQIYAGKTYKK